MLTVMMIMVSGEEETAVKLTDCGRKRLRGEVNEWSHSWNSFLQQ